MITQIITSLYHMSLIGAVAMTVRSTSHQLAWGIASGVLFLPMLFRFVSWCARVPAIRRGKKLLEKLERAIDLSFSDAGFQSSICEGHWIDAEHRLRKLVAQTAETPLGLEVVALHQFCRRRAIAQHGKGEEGFTQLVQEQDFEEEFWRKKEIEQKERQLMRRSARVGR